MLVKGLGESVSIVIQQFLSLLRPNLVEPGEPELTYDQRLRTAEFAISVLTEEVKARNAEILHGLAELHKVIWLSLIPLPVFSAVALNEKIKLESVPAAYFCVGFFVYWLLAGYAIGIIKGALLQGRYVKELERQAKDLLDDLDIPALRPVRPFHWETYLLANQKAQKFGVFSDGGLIICLPLFGSILFLSLSLYRSTWTTRPSTVMDALNAYGPWLCVGILLISIFISITGSREWILRRQSVRAEKVP